MPAIESANLNPSPRPGSRTGEQSDAAPRVLVVAARFLPDLGGIETHVHEVTRRMATRGDLNFTVLATDRSGDLPLQEDLGDFTVLRCRSYPRRQDYYIAPAIYRHIITGQYDLVHCQGIHTAVPILAMLAARKRRIPYMVTFHTGGHSSDLRHRLRGVQWRTLGPMLRGAAALVAVSRFEQEIFQKLGHLEPSRIRLIRNGGDLPSRVDRSEQIPGRIISCGRLERYKGHNRLIEALPFIQRHIPGATLRILGSGPYEAQLRSLIRTLGLEASVAIDFIAPNDRERMAQTLSSAALVAALSDYEAHPVALMEALTLGIPAVGLDTAGIGDLVQEQLVEGIPEHASAKTVAQIVVRALQDRRPGGSATLPTWDTAASELAQTYLEVVRGAPKRHPPRARHV